MIPKNKIIKILKEHHYKVNYSSYHRLGDIFSRKYISCHLDQINTDKFFTVKIKQYVIVRLYSVLKQTKNISIEDITKLRESFVFYQLPHQSEVTQKIDQLLNEIDQNEQK